MDCEMEGVERLRVEEGGISGVLEEEMDDVEVTVSAQGYDELK